MNGFNASLIVTVAVAIGSMSGTTPAAIASNATESAQNAALTPLQIMEKADHAARKAYVSEVAAVRLTTCKYKIVSGAPKCVDKPREVVADNAKKSYQDGNKFSVHSLLVVREPASDKGTGLLVYEYAEKGRDNDNWLYLPALGKVNRVIANDDEGGSVFGTEFSVESTQNPEARKVHEFTYKIIEHATFQKRPAWVIEMTPTAEKARKTSYQKIVAWIDKDNFMVLKEEYYRGGRVHKQRIQSGIRSIDGHYGATRVTVTNFASSRISRMDKFQIRRNIEVDDKYLTQRALTDFAFRERNLAQFRGELAKSKAE